MNYPRSGSSNTDKPTLISEVAKWERRRNTERARIKWLFTVDRTRVKLGRSYPATPHSGAAQAAA